MIGKISRLLRRVWPSAPEASDSGIEADPDSESIVERLSRIEDEIAMARTLVDARLSTMTSMQAELLALLRDCICQQRRDR